MVHLDQAEKLNYSKDGRHNSQYQPDHCAAAPRLSFILGEDKQYIPSRIAAEKLKNREKNAKMPHIIDIVA